MIRVALVQALSLWGALAVIRNFKESGLRLVGGPSRCQGWLQVQRTGQGWTEVDPGLVHPRFGHRVCAYLDCGSALSVKVETVPDRVAIRVLPDVCEDTSLIHCFDSDTRSPNSLYLNCSDSVRLVGGRSMCSGSLQIQDQSLNQSWTPVCEGALDRRGAEVLCRELGCGAPLLQGALSPLGQTIHCEGHESALMDCKRTQTWTDPGTCSGPALNLTCSELLRLVRGASRCEGILEVELRGEWRRVVPIDYFGSSFSWELESVAALCWDLDCGSAISSELRRGLNSRDVWIVSSSCVQESSAVRECVADGLSHHAPVGMQVVCSDSVRLVGGRSLCSGSLQTQDQSMNQSWTPVCEGALDRRGAEVLCRELGCGAPLLQGALSPLRQTFHCEGHESALMDCNRTQTWTDPGTCSGPALNLTCSEPLRLVGGASRCEGTVEAELKREWRRVMPMGLCGLEFAAAVCRELDCGSAVSTEVRDGFQNRHMWFGRSHCVKKGSAVRECVYPGSEPMDYGVQVACSDSVRLVGGRSLCSGSLQIQDQSLNQSWTPVCEGALDRRGAEVLCRELGCGAPLLQGALSPLGQTFHCEGHESALMDCKRTQTWTDPETCSGPALNLTCSEPLRLVGGASRCEGTVEAKFKGEWRRLLPYDPMGHLDPWYHPVPWDLESAAAVCRDLECGSAVSTEKREGFNISDVWIVSADGVRKSSAVRECIFDGPNDGFSDRSNYSLQVVCSDLLKAPHVSVSEGLWGPRAEGSFWARVQEGDWAPPGEAGVWVMMGQDFQIRCSVEPQYPGGYFQLISPPLNITLPAVNHSAHFLFTDVGHAHKGNYSCVYHLQVFNHTFTSHSALYVYPGESDLQFLFRAMILFLIQLLNLIPYFYYRRQMLQTTRGRQSSHRAMRYRAAPEEGTDAVIEEII